MTFTLPATGQLLSENGGEGHVFTLSATTGGEYRFVVSLHFEDVLDQNSTAPLPDVGDLQDVLDTIATMLDNMASVSSVFQIHGWRPVAENEFL